MLRIRSVMPSSEDEEEVGEGVSDESTSELIAVESSVTSASVSAALTAVAPQRLPPPSAALAPAEVA